MSEREQLVQDFMDGKITAEEMVQRLSLLAAPVYKSDSQRVADDAPLSLVRAHAAVRRMSDR